MRGSRLMSMQGGDGGGAGWGPPGGGGGSVPPAQPGLSGVAGQTVVGPLQFVPDGQQHGRPSSPSGMVPPPPPPTGKSRRSGGSGGKIGLIAGGVVALVLAATAGWYFFLRGAPKTPVPIGSLPSDTQRLMRQDVNIASAPGGLNPNDLPDEARWSMFAHAFCGAPTNVYRNLMRSYDDSEVAALGEALSEKEDLKRALSCGREVAENVGKRGALYSIAFRESKETRRVDVVLFDRKDLPETTKKMKSVKEADNIEQTYCIKKPQAMLDAMEKEREADKDSDEPRKKDKKSDKYQECTEKGLAKLADRNVWLVGQMNDIAKFGQEYSPDGKNKIEEMDLFEKVLNNQKGDVIEVGVGEAARSGVGYVSDEEVREKTQKALKGVKLVGHSIKLDGPWETAKSEYHCDGEEDAKDLESALRSHFRTRARETKDAVREMRDLEDKNKDDEEEEKSKIREKVEKLNKKWVKAKSDAEVRSLQEVEIEIDGKVVRVLIAEKPTKEEEQAWSELTDYMKERSEKAAAIVRQLEKGERPNGGELKALSEKLEEALNPPEWKTLDDIGGIRIPGSGMCRKRSLGSNPGQSCMYKKLTKDEVVAKMKEAAEEDGFTFKKNEYSDSSFEISKGSTKIRMMVFDDKSGGPTSLSLEIDK